MFLYMAVAGGKIIGFFVVILPIQIVFQLHNVWWLVLLSPTLLVLIRYVVATSVLRSNRDRTTELQSSPPAVVPSCCCISIKPAVISFMIILLLHLSIPAVVQWSEHVGCAPCHGRLPKKPGLIAHRGCGFVYPENTILSFIRSSQIPGMIGLETDVQVLDLTTNSGTSLIRTALGQNKVS